MLRDALTGLPNRIAFSERLDGPEADGQAMLETAILVADLDRFSRINDSLGHLAGDELLATIARRLLSAMREGDVLARIGGDVFGVIVRLTDGPGDALNVARSEEHTSELQSLIRIPYAVLCLKKK